MRRLWVYQPFPCPRRKRHLLRIQRSKKRGQTYHRDGEYLILRCAACGVFAHFEDTPNL